MESWLREIDDAIDTKENPASIELLESKLDLLSQTSRGTDPGLTAIMSCSQRLGIDIRQELIEVVSLMRDELLLRRHLPITAFQRWDFARKQDTAVLKLISRVFGGDQRACEQKVMALEGLLTRTDWLNDLSDDLKNRCFLFPRELDVQGVTLEQLREAKSWEALWSIPSFGQWYEREVVDLAVTWNRVRSSFREECETMFPRKLEGRFFYWAIFKELESEFRQAESRCL